MLSASELCNTAREDTMYLILPQSLTIGELQAIRREFRVRLRATSRYDFAIEAKTEDALKIRARLAR